MNIIKIDNITIKSASTWNELKRSQLLYIANNWSHWASIIRNNSLFTLSRLKMLAVLLGISNRKILNKKRKLFIELYSTRIQGESEESYIDRNAPLVDLLKTSDFIFKENTLTHNLFPHIPLSIFRRGVRGEALLKRNSLYGPSDELKNISLAEFSYADSFYLKYFKSKNTEDLDLMIACLYRPKQKEVDINSEYFTGDIREKFNKNTIEQRAAQIKKLHIKYKQAILLFYIGCRTYIVDSHPSVFPKDSKQKASRFGYASLILELSGQKFGNYEQTQQQELYTILTYLEVLAEKGAKAK